jgi:tyrosine-protein kinase Etk/Wzc
MKSEVISEQGQELQKKDALVQRVELLDRLITLSRRRRFIVRFTLGAAVLTAIIVLLIPNRYTATTLILPPAQSNSLSSLLLNQFAGGAGGGALASVAGSSLGIKSSGDMYVSFFRSRTVEDAIIGRFGLMSRYRAKTMTNARRAFETRSTVVLGTKDGLIRITVTDRDPKLAAEIANSYVDEFRRLTKNLAITEAAQRRMFFQQQLLEANEHLTVAEDAMKGMQQSTGVLQIDSTARALIESAALLRAQIVAKEVQLQAMRSSATDNNPQVVIAAQELAALKDQLAKLAGTGEDPDSGFIVPKGKIPEAGMEYLRKYRDLKYYETIAELIAKQYELAKLDEAREGAIVQVADVAIPPDRKSSPPRTLIVVLITLLAFIISVLWVFAGARWEQTLRDPEKRDKVNTLRGLLFSKKQR